jgi:hypothetical protein
MGEDLIFFSDDPPGKALRRRLARGAAGQDQA